MNLKTENLILREVVMSDINSIHALHSLPATDKFNTLGIPADIGVTQKLLATWIDAQSESPRMKYIFCIENNMHAFVGLMGINMGKPNYRNAEIWYKLHPSFWNKGYATEAVKSILDYCFNEMKLHRVTAGCATANIASVKVLEKAGFIREGHHKKILPIRGQWVDNYEYAILEEDYLK